QKLRKFVSKIRKALGAVQFEHFKAYGFEDLIEAIYKSPNIQTNSSLDELLYRIGRNEYQAEFNKDPAELIKKLNEVVKQQQNPKVKDLFNRILEWYKEIAQFEIPGYGKLI
ncbi:MAG: hypothetical protein QXE64_01550, partial [Candidatus Pacearchaeota archaeon]